MKYQNTKSHAAIKLYNAIFHSPYFTPALQAIMLAKSIMDVMFLLYVSVVLITDPPFELIYLWGAVALMAIVDVSISEMIRTRKCLSADEYNGLTRIAAATKMDCWFYIDQRYGVDCIRDLEEGTYIPMHQGLSELADGIIESPLAMGLTKQETVAVFDLLEKQGITAAYRRERKL